MWNNYTVDMLNPDKVATRQAEADAVRLADEARTSPGEARARVEHAFWATRGVERAVASSASRAARVREAAVAATRATGHRAALAAAGLRHAHRPHVAAGDHRA